MKTITIRLPDVEAAMLVELQKKDKTYRDVEKMLLVQIKKDYGLIY